MRSDELPHGYQTCSVSCSAKEMVFEFARDLYHLRIRCRLFRRRVLELRLFRNGGLCSIKRTYKTLTNMIEEV